MSKYKEVCKEHTIPIIVDETDVSWSIYLQKRIQKPIAPRIKRSVSGSSCTVNKIELELLGRKIYHM